MNLVSEEIIFLYFIYLFFIAWLPESFTAEKSWAIELEAVGRTVYF
jgi:hypothetical protein